MSKKMTIKQNSVQSFFTEKTEFNISYDTVRGKVNLPTTFYISKEKISKDVSEIEIQMEDQYSDDHGHNCDIDYIFKVEEYDDIKNVCTLTKKRIKTSPESIEIEIVKK